MEYIRIFFCPSSVFVVMYSVIAVAVQTSLTVDVISQRQSNFISQKNNDVWDAGEWGKVQYCFLL